MRQDAGEYQKRWLKGVFWCEKFNEGKIDLNMAVSKKILRQVNHNKLIEYISRG